MTKLSSSGAQFAGSACHVAIPPRLARRWHDRGGWVSGPGRLAHAMIAAGLYGPGRPRRATIAAGWHRSGRLVRAALAAGRVAPARTFRSARTLTRGRAAAPSAYRRAITRCRERKVYSGRGGVHLAVAVKANIM